MNRSRDTLAHLSGFVLVGLATSAAAAPLRWTRLPEDKFHCTKYDVDSAAPFVLTVPPGKALTFKITARAGKER